MSELLAPLRKDEKQKQKLYKEVYGIDTSGPLDPEYVKGRYDIVYNHSQGSERIADMAAEQSQTHENPAARELLAKQSRKYRRQSQLALEQTVDDIQKYVERNNGSYYEQAKADMDADLAKRPSAEAEFAPKLEDIKNLPEKI